MTTERPTAHIIGTGSMVPERILSNRDLESIVDTSDEWIRRRTGIVERRISSTARNESTSAMAIESSLRAMDMAGVGASDLDMIVVGTVTQDRMFPSAACSIQDALSAKNAAAFDISAGCCGFLYALSTVDNAIRCGTAKTALVVGVERLSSVINWTDRGTCVLLADGGGAVVVTSKNNGGGILSTHIQSDGSLWELLYSAKGNDSLPEILSDMDQKPFHLRMEGNRLFKRAIEFLTSISKKAMKNNSLSSDDISIVIPHQANIRIIQGMSKYLKIPMEKIFVNLDRYGNTSSGTIPIALDEANRQGLIKKGDLVLMTAFGAGLTWASSIVQWSI
ncbi:MAG: beta-ketoacyl-ACP synthase III [Thermodesulfobacteriota bacterium]|nr:beta-ketoacyl-ACP synthase III [Thermodesulfobacteriota bacterium]